MHLSLSQTNMHAYMHAVIRNLPFIFSWFQDTQLTRIPPQKESCSLVQRRKEIGASLRDGKLLKGKAQRLSFCLVNDLVQNNPQKPSNKFICITTYPFYLWCSLFALCCCWLCEECCWTIQLWHAGEEFILAYMQLLLLLLSMLLWFDLSRSESYSYYTITYYLTL